VTPSPSFGNSMVGMNRTTSVDSSVIFAAYAEREAHHTLAVRLLRDVGVDGPLVIAPVVPIEVWELAGRSFSDYARQRRSGSLPLRLMADFLAAAHAAHHGLRVVMFDQTVYDRMFPDLLVMSR